MFASFKIDEVSFELDTAVLNIGLSCFKTSIKQFVVDPVPIPKTVFSFISALIKSYANLATCIFASSILV